MKVSIDGILGSARRINSQRQTEEEMPGKKVRDSKSDSVTINNRINSRLDSIDKEIRDIQSSLTKSQITRNGLDQLSADLRAGSKDQARILNEVKFEGKPVLPELIGGAVNETSLKQGAEKNTAAISSDMDRVKRLNVELDNITASNLVGSEKTEKAFSGVNTLVSRIDSADLGSISRLNPDAVSRLIK